MYNLSPYSFQDLLHTGMFPVLFLLMTAAVVFFSVHRRLDKYDSSKKHCRKDGNREKSPDEIKDINKTRVRNSKIGS